MMNQKVVWSEGMFMKPHHFQQSDRYHEDYVNFRVNASLNYPWGVSEIEVDTEALENGSFSLLLFKGILFDGLSFNVPKNDKTPDIRDFKSHFSPASDLLEVFLAVPVAKPGTQTCRMAHDTDDRTITRYQEHQVDVIDENGGNREHKVGVGVKRAEIKFAGEPIDDYITIKIAEVVRSQTGSFSLKKEFVPPSLSVSASPFLMRFLGRVYERLISKSNTLRERRGQKNEGVAEFGSADITSLWLLYTLNSYIPLLKHFCDTGKGTPEALYIALARLGGELSTFSASLTPKDIPPYQNADLAGTFIALEEKLNAMLEFHDSSRFVPIPLRNTGDRMFVARIEDEALLDRAKLYIAVGGDYPAEELIEKIPKMTKICSQDSLELIINANMPGLGLSHTAKLPSTIAVKMGFQYFLLESFGKHWDGIRETRTLAISLPFGFSDANLELIAVR